MKHKVLSCIMAVAFSMAAPLLLGGCALIENGGSLALEELSSQSARLAGIFVTRDPIQPGPVSLEVNRRGEIVAKDTGPEKIYGSFTGYDYDSPVVTFPDLEGYGIYCLTAPEDGTHEAARYNSCDFLFANPRYNFSDQEESAEADLYVSADGPSQHYFNPVYQQPDGQIYLLAGSGISTDSFVDGQKFSQSISESVSHTDNGNRSVSTLRFTVNIVATGQPEESELLLMDEANRLMESYSGERLEELIAAQTPLALPGETSYLILRQSFAGKAHDSRSLFDRDAEYVEYMAPAEDGYLYFRQLPLAWP